MNTIIAFMKRHYKIIATVVVMAIGLWSFMPKKFSGTDPEKDKVLLEILSYVLEKGHYQPAKIDDNLSKKIYKDYLEALDPSKRFFLQSDIDEFSKYETKIDDDLNNRTFTFFNLTYDRLLQRMQESKTYYQDVLSKPIDFNVKEEYNTDFEKLPFAKNVKELKERWRKQTKFSVLGTLVDKEKMQEDLLKNASKTTQESLEEYKTKLGKRYTEELGKKYQQDLEKRKSEKPKSYEELEKESRESTLNSYNEYFNFVKDLDREDWFSVYINSVVSQFDPHTSYFPPTAKEKFDVEMSGKLEGIGARLQKKNDITEISELISGGPAWRGKELEAGDKILKVAQGNAEPVDVVGMRIDDVVKKIKGPKGTEVRLTVKKNDGTVRVISIIRDEVEIEETYAKSTITMKDGVKYGIINLPKFYIDFDNKDSRDAAKDVAQEVERLKQEGVEGIAIDLRDNGGGSLKTVIDIAGLFIDKGPVVQVRGADGRAETMPDKDERIQWNGPLVIMINEFSASASEILAAAMQDYKRGVIIGSTQSYGKGTVQNMIDLNNFVRGSNFGDLGALKATTQKFYRINGGSTQKEGVKSDVVMPDKYEYLKMGEKDVPNALAWDKIEPAKFTVWSNYQALDLAIANSKTRLLNNQQLKLIDENAKFLDSREDIHSISLNINDYKAEQKKLEEANKKFKAITKYNNGLSFMPITYDKNLMSKDETLKEKREVWFDDLTKDVYVEEAVNILNDIYKNSSKTLAQKKG
ncbi:carboxy terminal-processing peptidase [Flavobacterium croceum]|uniref:carboxy terminal-processing peptidase n=1 Tax=Flavobacterium croceum TaxID=370975 RepID=UPI0024A9DA0F|nr:carboxy terminal-processing peptidase [Flavobacterium croceum]